MAVAVVAMLCNSLFELLEFSFLLSIDEAHGHCLVCIWESLKIKKKRKKMHS